MSSEPADDRSFALAASLHAAWQYADPELRVDLERVIRAYVQREPRFRAALKQVATLHEQGGPVPRQVLHRYVTQLRQPQRPTTRGRLS